MLDFETPSYVTAKEAQHMQSQVNTPSASFGTQKHYKRRALTTPSLTLQSFKCLFEINLSYKASYYLQICFSLLDVTLCLYNTFEN